MQGADKVNDELEVGFDRVFEHRWVWVQRTGVVVMVLFSLATLAGLFGRGPFSHRTLAYPPAALSVDFEPVARAQTPTQVTFHLHNGSDSPEVALFIGTTSIEPMGLQRFLPEPVSTRSVVGGLVATFAVPPGTADALIRLVMQPAGPGLVHQEAQLPDHPAIRWTQWVMP